MTEINYENGVVVVSQYGVSTIRFRPCDLNYDSISELVRAAMDMPIPREAGGVGFLKTQSVDVRQAALEEALGISFPCGRASKMITREGYCDICGHRFETGDIIHEFECACEPMTACDMCYHDVLRRG